MTRSDRLLFVISALGCALAILLAFGLPACGDDFAVTDGAAPGDDSGVTELGLSGDGGGPLAAAFTMVGCEHLDFQGATPRCSGPAPLDVTFVPLAAGVSTYLWTFQAGDPASSNAISPAVRFGTIGAYTVTLVAGGASGSSTFTGMVVVTSGALGDPCLSDSDCAAMGLMCLCAGDAACPASLRSGICTRECGAAGGLGASACDPGALCADLTRGVTAAAVDGGTADGGGGALGAPWRRALCLPSCLQAGDCVAGRICRALPALMNGAQLGGAYQWKLGCFAEVPGEIGDACLDADGAPAPDRCLSGRCDPLGARGLCTADCTADPCSTESACVTFNQAGTRRCLVRCDGAHLCAGDPLLDCELPGVGGLGFSPPPDEPAGTAYCAPKRCTKVADCAPAGTCAQMGAASFCTR
jgi:PKD repeat protein